MSDSVELGAYLDSEEPCELKISKLVTGRTAVIAKTGYGKSWTLRRVAEQLLDAGYPIGIIDPEGEHVSLADEYEMLVVSPKGDVDLAGGGSVKRLAKAAVRGVSFVLDLSVYVSKPDVAAGLVSDLIRELMEQKGSGFLIMIDEARELAPERGAKSQLGKYASQTELWVNTLATRGRKRGVGLLFTTQRPQLVSKTLLSQAENKIVLRVEYNADVGVISRFLGLDREVTRRIKQLNPGEAYVEGPFVDRPGFVKVGPVKTAHLGTTPLVKPRPPPSLAEVVSYITSDVSALMEDRAAPERGEVAAPQRKGQPRERERFEPGKARKAGGRGGGEAAKRRPGLEAAWEMPSDRLESEELAELVKRRNELRRMLELLEESRGEMREEVYEFLREEYEEALSEVERRIEPFRREARISELIIEAALQDRQLRLRFLEESSRGALGALRKWFENRRLHSEIQLLSEKLERVRGILEELS
ncbi:MAG: DUF87 domain-containing protein [Candidatus Korarchaeota archaeon]|nr:DUF87 domain-containing protein [Candidatus Korarchaeota archaeon]